MSGKEFYPSPAEAYERRASRRFAIIIAISILLAFAMAVTALFLIYTGKFSSNPPQPSPMKGSTSACVCPKAKTLEATKGEIIL